MIWHFLEIWFLLLVVFAAGCGLGAVLHVGLAAGPLAIAQDRFADAIGDMIDGVKWRLGMAPDWRPEYRRFPDWPMPGRQGDEPRFDESVTIAPSDQPPSDEAEPSQEVWTDDENWPQDQDSVYDAYEEDAPGATAATEDDEAPGEEPEAGEVDTMRPAGLAEPRAGVPDNLQRIWGIGKRNEALLHSLGIFHFGQIAAWTPAEARWVAERLAFPERLERDNWIGQAIVLATGGDPSTVSPANDLNNAKDSD